MKRYNAYTCIYNLKCIHMDMDTGIYKQIWKLLEIKMAKYKMSYMHV